MPEEWHEVALALHGVKNVGLLLGIAITAYGPTG